MGFQARFIYAHISASMLMSKWLQENHVMLFINIALTEAILFYLCSVYVFYGNCKNTRNQTKHTEKTFCSENSLVLLWSKRLKNALWEMFYIRHVHVLLFRFNNLPTFHRITGFQALTSVYLFL